MHLIYPERFRTGVKNQTIPNPFGMGTVFRYQGHVDGYDFAHQASNRFKIDEALAGVGDKLEHIAVGVYRSEGAWKPGSRLVRFVACSRDGNLMWEKYEGWVPGGGQNHVYVGGYRIKTTHFLGLSWPKINEAERLALLSWSKTRIALVFSGDEGVSRLRSIDASK